MFDLKLKKPKFWDNKNLSIFSIILSPLSLLTIIVNFIKKFQNKKNYSIKTICIGNIYIGGTGKTPLAIKINDKLKNKFKTVFIKKNYYDQIDEQKLLREKGNIIIDNKRHFALKKAIEEKYELAIIDDGLQEKNINYDISIACFNGSVGFGNGMMIPSGPLRESLSELKSYNAVFINGDKKRYLINLIKNSNNKIKIFNGKYFLKNKKDFSNKKRYFAFCGIGTPENFFKLLKENNIKLKDKLIFPDHYDYKLSDVNRIKKLAKDINCQLITTEKDYMKIKKFKNFKTKFAKIDLKIYDQAKFINFLKKNL